MKECKYCRTKYEDSLSACPSCGGNKIVTEKEKAEEESLYQREIENRERAITEQNIKKKGMMVVLIAVFIIIIAVIALISYNANKPLSNGMTKDEGETVLKEGIAFYDAGDYESAIECFDQLPSDSKLYKDAQDMLVKCKEEYAAIVIEKLNAYMQKEEYDTAMELINKAQEVLPNNAELQVTFCDAYRQSVLNKVTLLEQEGNLVEILSLLERALETLKNDAELQDVYATTYATYKQEIRTAAIKEADVYATNGDYENAIKVISNAQNQIGEDDELIVKYDLYTDVYISQKVTLAKERYVKYDVSSTYAAIDILNAASEIIPDNEELKSELAFYNESLPIRIIAMSPSDNKVKL